MEGDAVMKKLCASIAYLLVFLLPWQTVWIIQEKMIGRAGTSLEGIWQYGIVRLYAVEVVIIVLIVFSLVLGIKRFWELGIHEAWSVWSRSKSFLLDISLAFFCVLSFVSVLWSPDKGAAIFATFRIVEGVFLFFLFRTAPLNSIWLASAFLSGAVIQSTIGIVQFFFQNSGSSTLLGIATHDPATLGTAVVQAGDRRWLRAYGAFPHPNVLGAYLSIGMMVCVGVLARAKEKWQWIFLLIASQIILAGLLLTFSRSAWISLIVAGILSVVLSLPRKREFSRDFLIHPVAVLVLASVITTSIFSFYFFDEIKGRIGIESSRLERQSIDERVSSLSRAVPLFKSVWYRGTGIGNFTNALFLSEKERDVDVESYTYQPLHNVFLMIFAELGILGSALLALMFVFYVRALPPSSYPLLSTILMLSLFDHFLWTLPFGIFFAALCLGVTIRRPTLNGAGA